MTGTDGEREIERITQPDGTTWLQYKPDESAKEWAARQMAEHGPLPKEVEDRIRAIMRRNGF